MSKRSCQAIVWLAGLLGACGPDPAIDINPNAALVTSEAGKSVRLAISLLQPPHGTLTVSATASDATEASVSGPLRFDDGNWQTPQDIVVTGLDDAEVDGDIRYQVVIESLHSSLGRTKSTVEVLSFVNVDDDSAPGTPPAVDIKPSAELVTSEAGKSVQLAVSLRQPPHGSLTVSATASDATEASVSGPLRFDDSNWQTPQAIVVTGLDDAETDGDVVYQVAIESQHSPSGWRSVEVLSFVNVDDDKVAGEVATFHGLGDLPGGETASYVSALSAAGDVVVGWSGAEKGDEATRWTLKSGLLGLGGDQSRANNVSENGRVIVGSVAEASYEGGRAAAISRDGSPIQVVAPYPPNLPIMFYPVDATVALDSGDFFGACIQRNAYGERLICHVTAAGDFETSGIGDVYAGDEAGHLVGAVNPDSHSLGLRGPAEYDSGLLSAPLTYPTTPECVIPHQCAAIGRAFSTNPATIVGTALVPPVGRTSMDSTLINVGFVVTDREGVTRLPDLAGGAEDSGAYAIDASGRVIGGFGADASGRHAVVWVDRVPRLLTDVVASAGGTVPAGWSLSEVRAISRDGRTFAGNATNPAAKPEGFVAVLPTAL